MIDRELRRLIDPPLDRAGRHLESRGLGANTMTLAGFAVGLACIPAIAFQLYWLAALLMILNRIADGLDGAIARAHGKTDFGGYLDIVCDFIFYAGFVFAFALAAPANALAAAFLAFSFMGTASSFLAHAILVEKNGGQPSNVQNKSFFHSRGLAEGTETIACFAALLAFPSAFVWIAYAFGAMCWLTTALRVRDVWTAFGR